MIIALTITIAIATTTYFSKEHVLDVVLSLDPTPPPLLHPTTYLSKEHVLDVVLSLDDRLSVVLHERVLCGVPVDLALDLFVLTQQSLGLCEIAGDVLGGDRCLRAGQPLLEVVEVLQELLKVARLAETLVTHLQLRGRRNENCVNKIVKYVKTNLHFLQKKLEFLL